MVLIINLLDYKVLKCKHIDGFYKYLLQLNPTMWAVIVTDDNDNQVFVEADLSYKISLYKYNHWEEGKESNEERF